LQQLSRQPLRAVLLWVMAIVLFTLVPWQILEATIGREESNRDGRLASAGRAVVYFELGILAVGVALGNGGGSGGDDTVSTRVLHPAIHLLDATRSRARAAITDNDMLVKVLQTSVDDEKSFGVMLNPPLPVRRMGKPGLNRSVGPIPGRREGAQR
jgi:hypothetical protein